MEGSETGSAWMGTGLGREDGGELDWRRKGGDGVGEGRWRGARRVGGVGAGEGRWRGARAQGARREPASITSIIAGCSGAVQK